MKMIPVIRGKLGSTEYFIATMKAAEVVSTVRIPKEMPDWDKESLEERYQREINYKRVKQQIAPYLAEDPDRFFGSLIVDILDADTLQFESLVASGWSVPKVFKQFAESFGILYLSGSERLVPLDGQHRLAGLKFAMNGKDEKDAPITNFTPNDEIANDDVTLILVRHDPIKARKIFNKVNRYAKSTSKAENLITADDDAVAIIARVIADDEIGARLVNFSSNTLPPKSPAFTTLGTLYEASLHYLERSGIAPHKVDTTRLPSPEIYKLWEMEITRLWTTLLEEVAIFRDALLDGAESGDGKRIELRKSYVIMKPIAQAAVVVAIARAIASGASLERSVELINQLDWKTESSLWQHVLMNVDKVVTGKQAMNFASRIIAYMIGEKLEDVEITSLQTQYINQFPQELRAHKKLPDRLV